MVSIENQTLAVVELNKAFEDVKAALEEIINYEEESVIVDKRNPGCAKCKNFGGILFLPSARECTEFTEFNSYCKFKKEEKEVEKYDPVWGLGKRPYIDYASPDSDNANGECPYFELKIWTPKKTILEKITLWIKKLFARS